MYAHIVIVINSFVVRDRKQKPISVRGYIRGENPEHRSCITAKDAKSMHVTYTRTPAPTAPSLVWYRENMSVHAHAHGKYPKKWGTILFAHGNVHAFADAKDAAYISYMSPKSIVVLFRDAIERNSKNVLAPATYATHVIIMDDETKYSTHLLTLTPSLTTPFEYE